LLIREGRLTIPDPLSTLVFDEFIPKSRQARTINPIAQSKTDIAIIELSTIKEYSPNGFHFQTNHIDRHIVSHFDTPEDAEIWWKEIERDDRNQDVIDKTVPSSLSPELQDTARHMRATTQTPENIIAGMKDIAAVLSVPTLWVSHNRLAMADGNRIPQREILVNAMRKGAANLGQGFFEPTPYIETFGQAKAMEADDIFHYTQDFIGVLGVILQYSLNEAFDQSLIESRRI
jgi:hypothetical protein